MKSLDKYGTNHRIASGASGSRKGVCDAGGYAVDASVPNKCEWARPVAGVSPRSDDSL